MTTQELWNKIVQQLRAYLDTNIRLLLAQNAPSLEPDLTLPDGRLLALVVQPAGNPIADLICDIAGDLTADSRVQLHFWRRDEHRPDELGLALVLKDVQSPGRMAVVGVTPAGAGDPIIDVVVTPGGPLTFAETRAEWSATVTVAATEGWTASSGSGMDPGPPKGTVALSIERKKEFKAGMQAGPGLSVSGFAIGLSAIEDGLTSVSLDLHGLEVALLPAELAKLVGSAPGDLAAAPTPQPVSVTADHVNGLHFNSGGLNFPLPVRLNTPGLQGRGTMLTVSADGSQLSLGVTTSLTASLPGLPLTAMINGAGFSLPVEFPPQGRPGFALEPAPIDPTSIGVDLKLPPVSGGGNVTRIPGGYAGVVAADLGVIGVQAVAQFRPPSQTRSATSFLMMLGVVFPPPGIQLSFGFALDAVGGLVGVNHRVDVTALRQLVSDGNADRILFPDNIVERADQVIGALSDCFPPAPGRFVIAPMVRITWGGRMVSLSGALILELPAPVQAVILGRLLVGIPDPVVPLIKLQATVLGRLDPGIPEFELLVSLAGSYIVGLTIQGEIYLLVRGGDNPEFVLSAGGFHPRFVRPAGVPALQRLAIDMAPGGGYGMRIEAYVALTSTSVQFGGQLHLEAMIAGCGVEGWLGLDALFRFEPTFSFSVQVRAGVAVRAFGTRLASVALAFTLEGPAPWHAFGYGSVSVLFWDASLDFDIGWGSPPAIRADTSGDERAVEDLKSAIAKPKAWMAERPQNERTGLTFTAAAAEAMAEGRLVHPDATLRLTQAVVPLGVTINRYSRQRVPDQLWKIAAITLGTAPPRAVTEANVVQQFVRGEFFDLTEDEQLTAPPMVTYASGTTVGTSGFELAEERRVNDKYETAYEPERTRDPQAGKDFRTWPGRFADEAAHRWLLDERLERWRSAAGPPAVQVRAPRLRAAASGGAVMHTLEAIVGPTEVPADGVAPGMVTTDPWQVIRDQGQDVATPPQFLESWEVSA